VGGGMENAERGALLPVLSFGRVGVWVWPAAQQGLNHVTPNRAFREKSRVDHCRSLCKVASMVPYGLILSLRSMQSAATAVLAEEAMAALASMRCYRKLMYLHS